MNGSHFRSVLRIPEQSNAKQSTTSEIRTPKGVLISSGIGKLEPWPLFGGLLRQMALLIKIIPEMIKANSIESHFIQ
jgi:hypothetical protein